ncbi:calcium-independent phospholipase A2-gamma [Esox lucius]|nr:calcium-independent phospholipase A2-gamma [Esox lucius]XP_010893435.2 calcium-independent phospholipase A2-gamma [Esox lucius]XP_019911805.2 calcium-independent phospholipase A2-gamma [Esox lucius]XP_019911806.2 calcium-independent phospholipase A2-gamma [Esox lucius]XP_019911807.2 calcium-independent phospholipase A2-gamma [Esox lucius]XP_019911809.2 calcium-independent phospholipase A2-gamma [Esox lucius]
MSRIRSTLDSVAKAVSGTDLLSKISRLKPGVEPLTASPTTAASERSAPPVAMEPTEQEDHPKERRPVDEEEKGKQAVEKHFTAAAVATTSTAVASSTASSSSAVAKQTLQRFHPAVLSANMDETHSSLARHVDDYFGSSLSAAEDREPRRQNGNEPALDQRPHSTKSGRHVPVRVPVAGETEAVAGLASTQPSPHPPETATPPSATPAPETAAPTTSTSPKKGGFGQYLSDPRPNVQAFFGSYIAPLVPSKFRGDPRSVTAGEKAKVVAKAGEKTVAETEEEKRGAEEKRVADERAKKFLLSQREKITARVGVDNQTRALVQGLQKATDVKLYTCRVEELNLHLLEFPETRGVAVKERVIPCLLRLRQARDPGLQAAVREALALLGYTDPVKGRGIRVLAIDGGGTRGLVALQTLQKLQTLTGKPIYQLFDYICGVSTGAILAFMLGVFHIPLDECEELYRKLGSDVFTQNVIVGTVKMGWSHAFYDSQIWENILKERMGEGLMVETARDPKCPKVSAVSTIVNRGLPLKAYVFRNYSMLPGVRSHYLGDCKHKMWQAIRASSAAPGYFQEYTLGKDLHQDGGLLINNPTALAIHECKLLWPNSPLQCVVSLGTGRYETAGKNSTTYTSLKAKITNVISSATDTEEVHTMLDALLPPNTYFRFNPYMSEDIPLDESRPERLTFLKEEGTRYLERNEAKLRKAASVLALEKSAIQRLAEWATLKADMYEGLPFISKL